MMPSPTPWPSVMRPCHHVSTGLPPYSWTRRLLSSPPTGAGENQMSWPAGLTIIAPGCTLPSTGVRNTSPSDGSAAGWLTVTSGGCSVGWLRKLDTGGGAVAPVAPVAPVVPVVPVVPVEPVAPAGGGIVYR